jgi:hypothetical protein
VTAVVTWRIALARADAADAFGAAASGAAAIVLGIVGGGVAGLAVLLYGLRRQPTDAYGPLAFIPAYVVAALFVVASIVFFLAALAD